MTITRAHPALIVDTCFGEFAIDSIDMQTPAWAVTTDGLSTFWSGPGKRGSDLETTDDGAEAHARRPRLPGLYSLRFVIVGAVNQSGVPYADPYAGLATNRKYLHDQLEVTPATAGGTRTGSMTFPGMAAQTGDLHVIRFAGIVQKGAFWLGTLDVELLDDALFIGS